MNTGFNLPMKNRSLYVPCVKCGRPQSSKHAYCMDCRKQECAQCKEVKISGNFVGKLCRRCAKKRGLS